MNLDWKCGHEYRPDLYRYIYVSDNSRVWIQYMATYNHSRDVIWCYVPIPEVPTEPIGTCECFGARVGEAEGSGSIICSRCRKPWCAVGPHLPKVSENDNSEFVYKPPKETKDLLKNVKPLDVHLSPLEERVMRLEMIMEEAADYANDKFGSSGTRICIDKVDANIRRFKQKDA